MTEVQREEKFPVLSTQDKKNIVDWCYELLRARLTGAKAPPAPLIEGRAGVFVTLKRKGKLRGCIGSFSWSEPLIKLITSMTESAAFQDYRFPQLTLPELEDLDITISLLTPLEPLKDLNELVIGRDGLFLNHPKGRGVLLPVVAEEQGWNALQFAQHTCLKAGLGPQDYLDPGAELLVFTAPHFSRSDFM
ncbi:MAG: AmmeMemoRadiSam system protein A [Deltaproteobacteria bacterium]|jgi:AmmeMemoRadiSam system protein A|nr:AmmeMemoRadiSam system protein A [Deltaproteobacteria bacterium]